MSVDISVDIFCPCAPEDLPRSQNTFLLEFLNPGKTYRIRVRAFNEMGMSEYSEWNLTGNTKTSKPERPANAKAIAGSWASLTLEARLPFSNGALITSMQVKYTHFHLYAGEERCKANS